ATKSNSQKTFLRKLKIKFAAIKPNAFFVTKNQDQKNSIHRLHGLKRLFKKIFLICVICGQKNLISFDLKFCNTGR
ncbi:MAG: hypothetical protein LBP59_19390, partial [Planctomycetaceae bacterium]|nr:hypothetical protein [Planctomycetaceae bacterium]